MVAKPVKSVLCGHPDIAFPVLHDSVNAISGEAICLRKGVRLTPVHMQKSTVQSSDPEISIAVAEHSLRLKLP
jgi:hypothetical protein